MQTPEPPFLQKTDSLSSLKQQRDQVTIVIATLNEADAIGPLLDEVKAAGYDNILVVDGYSHDATRAIAEERGAKVVGQHGKGKSGAILAARDLVDTTFFLLMDGDATYDPKDIDRFVLYANGYDHIIGFRPRHSPNISRSHKFGNWVLTKTFNMLMGSNVPDVACGMYLMRTEKVRKLILDVQGFAIDQEIAAQMLVDGKVSCVPIHYRPRTGEAKAPTWRQGFRALYTITDLALHYNPILLFSFFASLALIPALGLLGYASYLQLFIHQYHGGYFLASVVLFVLGSQGLTVAVVGTLSKTHRKKD